MTDCDHMSSRMPEVASGRARWGAVEEQHLADCDACRLEWDVVRRVARLGAGRELQLNEAAIADAVLRRLRTVAPAAPNAVSHRRIWRLAGTAGAAGIAAALVLLVHEGVIPVRAPVVAAAPEERTIAEAPIATGPLELAVPELDDVPVEALDAVLQALDRPFQADELLESSWSDVESREFERGFNTVSVSSTSGG